MPETEDKLINGVNVTKLHKSVEWSYKQLEQPRKNRLKAIDELVGRHYGLEESNRKRVPTNFIELATTVYSRLLAPKVPQVLVGTKVPELKPFASELALAMNQIPEELDMKGTVRKTIIEALFSVGIVKVGLTATGQNAYGHDPGTPFVDLISLDDYFCDMSAKDYTHIQYEGNTYWMTMKDLQADETFPKEFKKDLSADSYEVSAGEAGSGSEDRAEDISRNRSEDLYEDRVRLRDVYIVDKQKLVTYSVSTEEPLRCIDWDGPISGPYHRLGFSDVPGNLMPLPPVSVWLDLHELSNRIFRKISKQADLQKTVYAFNGDDDQAVQALKAASDGEGIRMKSTQAPTQIKIGGVDPTSMAFFMQASQLSSYYAGNVDSLAGLAPQTDTVGQDKLMNEAANTRLASMQDNVYEFLRGLFKTLAWYTWTDPIRERELQKPIPGSDQFLTVQWTPDTRDGDFLDYNFDINVFSMQDDSPSAKLNRIGAIMANYVMPLMPMIQAQGGEVDVNALMKLISEYSNTPELADIVKMQQEVTQATDPSKQQQGSEIPTVKPAETTRNYNRTSTPGATKRGQADVLVRQLLGGNVQETEAAQLDQRV